MFKPYRYILLGIASIFLTTKHTLGQHDPMFSQFYATSTYLNPALCGLDHTLAFSFVHRTQWIGLNPYSSNLVNVVLPYHDKGEKNYHKGGFGLNALNSTSGDGSYSMNGASINAAYNIHISASTAQTLTFGLQIGFMQKQASTANYQWGSQYDITTGVQNSSLPPDPLFSNGSYSTIYPDIGAGLLYYYNAGRNVYAPGISAYIGLAASHLNAPNESFISGESSKVPTLWKLHSGFEIHLAKKLNLSPNVIYMTNGKGAMLATGANFTYLFPDHDKYLQLTRLIFGSSYRFGDAIIFQVGFGSKYYNLGLSYDMGASTLASISGKAISSYEISFKTSVHIGKKSKKSSKFHTPLM